MWLPCDVHLSYLLRARKRHCGRRPSQRESQALRGTQCCMWIGQLMINSSHQVKELGGRWDRGGIGGCGWLHAAKQVGDGLGGTRARRSGWVGWEGVPVSKFSVSIGWRSSWHKRSVIMFGIIVTFIFDFDRSSSITSLCTTFSKNTKNST